MTVTTREAEPGDRERLIELFQALNRYEDALTGDRRVDRAGAEDSLAGVETRMAETQGVCLVAEVDGAGEDRVVVGLLTLTFEEGAVYLRPEARPHAHICDLVVDGAWRRRGIGAALMTAAEKIAAQRGYRQVTIGVLASNETAEAAYLRQGFQPLGVRLVKKLGGE